VPVEAALYPVGLVVAGRPCLVVGAGRIAARKVDGLRACGADVTVIAPEISDEIAARDDVEIVRRPYEPGDVAGYQLVITATGDPDVDEAVFADAEAGGIWANSADDPDHCSFLLPAVLRRGPVVVSVATGGNSPALATWLRDRLAEEVGEDVARVALELADERRRLHTRGESTEGRDWRPLIESRLAADHGRAAS
jgi:siroheme synthase-like protein